MTVSGQLTAGGLSYPTSDGTNEQVLQTDGSGNLSFGTISGTTINNNTNNYVMTGTGTANTLNGESGLVFDGTNLGIGAASPDQLLQVGSESYGANAIIKTQVDGSDVGNFDSGLHMRSHDDNFGVSIVLESRSVTNDIVNFKYHNNSSAGVTAMAIDAVNGNVGIGTTSPTAKLEVSKGGSTAAQGDTDLLVRHSSAAGTTAQVQILAGNTGFSNLYLSDTDAYNVGGFIYNHSSNYLATNVNGSERMRIDSSGNVGIGLTPLYSGNGTARPSLEIGGSTEGNLAFNGTGKDGLIITNSKNIGGVFKAAHTGLASAYGQTAGQHIWYTAASVSADSNQTFNERMRIDTSGNVGIGTTSPSTELHIKSTDQNALTVETDTAINQIHLSNSTNSPTYLTQDSYGFQIKADENGWGGTASFFSVKVKASEVMRIDSTGVVHAKAGLGAAPITSCTGFTGTAGYKYLIKPVGALEPFWAVYSGDNYKSRGKGYFRWWYGYGDAATGNNQNKVEVDYVNKDLEFYEVIVEDMAGTTYQSSAPAYEYAYWSTRQKFNAQGSNTTYATSSSMTGNIEALWGGAGGHGLYESVIGNTCSWGVLNANDAIGSGYTGSCGTYPSTVQGVPDPHYANSSLRLGRPITGSASFTQSTGAFSYWFNF